MDSVGGGGGDKFFPLTRLPGDIKLLVIKCLNDPDVAKVAVTGRRMLHAVKFASDKRKSDVISVFERFMSALDEGGHGEICHRLREDFEELRSFPESKLFLQRDKLRVYVLLETSILCLPPGIRNHIYGMLAELDDFFAPDRVREDSAQFVLEHSDIIKLDKETLIKHLFAESPAERKGVGLLLAQHLKKKPSDLIFYLFIRDLAPSGGVFPIDGPDYEKIKTFVVTNLLYTICRDNRADLLAYLFELQPNDDIRLLLMAAQSVLEDDVNIIQEEFVRQNIQDVEVRFEILLLREALSRNPGGLTAFIDRSKEAMVEGGMTPADINNHLACYLSQVLIRWKDVNIDEPFEVFVDTSFGKIDDGCGIHHLDLIRKVGIEFRELGRPDLLGKFIDAIGNPMKKDWVKRVIDEGPSELGQVEEEIKAYMASS